MSNEITDDKLNDILTRALGKYLKRYAFLTNRVDENTAIDALAGKLQSDPEFESLVTAYFSINLAKKNNWYQSWVVYLAFCAIVVSAAVAILK